MLHDVVIHVASIAEFQDEIEFIGRVDHLVQPNDVPMLNGLHACHFLEEMRLGDFIEFHFIDHFHCHISLGEYVSSEFDHGEMPSANRGSYYREGTIKHVEWFAIEHHLPSV